MAAPVDLCNLCFQSLTSHVRFKKFNYISSTRMVRKNKNSDPDISFLDVVEMLGVPAHDLEPLTNTERKICYDCGAALGNIASSVKRLNQRINKLACRLSDDATLGRKLKACLPCDKFKPRAKPNLMKWKRNDEAASFLWDGQCSKALRLLLQNEDFQKTFRIRVQVLVSQEIQNLYRSMLSPYYSDSNNIVSYKRFPWSQALADVKENCPLFYAVLLAVVFSSGSARKSLASGKFPKKTLKPAMGSVIGQLLFMRYPKRMKLLPQALGVHLRRTGCPMKTFPTLQQIRLTPGITGLRTCLRRARRNIDEEIPLADTGQTSRTVSEGATLQIDGVTHGDVATCVDDCGSPCSVCTVAYNEIGDVPMEEYSLEGSEAAHTIQGEEMEEVSITASDIDFLAESMTAEETGDVSMTASYIDPLAEPSAIGSGTLSTNPRTASGVSPLDTALLGAMGMDYTLCFGVKEKLRPRRPELVQAYAARNRVPTCHLSDKMPSPADIMKITLDAFRPDHDDYLCLRNGYRVIVQRLLKKNLPHLFSTVDILNHVEHEHFSESKEKSVIIPLTPLNTRKSTEMVDVLRHLHQYVPGTSGQMRPRPVILYGDGLSCERTTTAKKLIADASSQWGRLEGLCEAVQEGHKRRVLLANTFSLLDNQEGARDIGTLRYIRYSYCHSNVHDDVTQSFPAAVDLLNFATESYVTALACLYLGLDDPDKTPSVFMVDKAGEMFEELTDNILEEAFRPPFTDEVRVDECRICHKPAYGQPMTSCVLCGSLYHQLCTSKFGEFTCLVVRERCLPAQCNDPDHVYEYTKALLHRGLGEMVRQDAIREADGPRMLTYWKWDLYDFVRMRNNRCFSLGVHLLADVNGATSAQLAQQLIWNRTINVTGGAGNNMEMDVGLESLKASCRLTSLDQASGCQTSELVNAHNSQREGTKGVVVLSAPLGGDSGGDNLPSCDVTRLAKELLANRCVEEKSGRLHSGFPQFVHQVRFGQQRSMKRRIEGILQKKAEKICLGQATTKMRSSSQDAKGIPT